MSIKALDDTLPAADGPAGQGDDELRALKTALQACFGGPLDTGGLDGAITQEGGDFPTAAEWSALFTRLAAVEGSAGTGVVGEVKMFYGDTANIPAGWYLCDGTNGTPDMRGRFLIGGNESPADGLPLYGGATTGGAVGEGATGDAGDVTAAVTIPDHVLTEDNLPAHYHHIAYDNGSAGNSSGPDADSAKGIKMNWANGSGDGYVLKQTDGVYGSEAPNVGRTSLTGGAGTPDPLTHGTVNVNIPAHSHSLEGALPPWHAVHYIMYTGV